MPSKRPGGLNPIADGELSSSDELAVYDKSADRDLKATVAQLATALKTVPGGTGATSLNGLSDVDAPTPANLQVLQFDSSLSKDPPDPLNPGAWTNATIAADTVTLQVSNTVGTATPSDPLTGSTPTSTNAFALPSQAIRWAKDNLRITTNLTLNIASSANPYQEPTNFTVGGDGYLTILQGPAGGGVTINDSPGTTGNSGFITAQGRVNLTNVIITSRRWALYSQRGCSTLITASTITNLDDNQAIQGTDMQIRFSGICLVRGTMQLDNSLSIATSAQLTVTTAKSPAITFRGNADCIWGGGSTIGFGGTGRTVQIENVSGIRTDSAVWLGGPTFNYITVQPVRSDIAGLPNGSSKVFNMVVVAALPGNPDPNTFYAIP